MQRRHLLQGLIAGGTLGLAGCASLGGTSASKAKVLVIGGGYGGTTASKYIRLLSDYTIDVMMVEPNRQFVSCPVSNLVIGGQRKMADITNPYNGLSDKHGVRIVHDMVTSVDAVKKTATLAGGTVVQYDKLVMSPGIDFMWDQTEGLKAAHEAGQILHAWKAGAETVALRQQLEAMRDGGTYAITIPEAPYRCPPGPYERASVIAAYFKKAWAELYGGMVEYRPQHKAIGVDAKTRTVKFEVQDDVKADVLNVLPVMRAGALAVNTGLANANARWCHVNFLNFESTAAKDIHIIGDAIQIAQGMPKSGHMANSHAKVTAAAIVAELQGLEVNPHPMLTNVCMSFVDDAHVIHVASVHEYQAPKKSFFTIGGSGGVSDVRSDLEGRYADAWAKNIWADMLT